jgi:hypothetical protein
VENAPASLVQLPVTQVMIAGARMLATIGFDDQARIEAREIDDVGRDRELASKSPAKPIIAEFSPQHLLGVCHIPTQLTRVFLARKPAPHVCPIGRHNPHPTLPRLRGRVHRRCTGGHLVRYEAILDVARDCCGIALGGIAPTAAASRFQDQHIVGADH